MSWDDGKHTGPRGRCNPGGSYPGGFGPRGPHFGSHGPGGFGPGGHGPGGFGPGGHGPGGFGPGGCGPGGRGSGGPEDCGLGRPGGPGGRGPGGEGCGPGGPGRGPGGGGCSPRGGVWGPGGRRPGGGGRGPGGGGWGPGGRGPGGGGCGPGGLGGHGPGGGGCGPGGPGGHGPGGWGPGGPGGRGPSGSCPGSEGTKDPYPGSDTVPETPIKPAKKLGGKGGDDGVIWDDGFFDDVRKVHVGQYERGVSFIKIEYNKGSQVIIGDGHGKQSMLEPEKFELDYPSEYIIALKGKYDTFPQEKEKGGNMTCVTTLTFVTNKRTSRPYGLDAGKPFEIKEEGHKIVGFHGKAADYVHQIGVYVVPITT